MFRRFLIVIGMCGVWGSDAAAQAPLSRRSSYLHDRRADAAEVANSLDAEPTNKIPVAWTAKLDAEVRAEQAIRHALEQRINLVTSELRLRYVIDVFTAKTGVPCVVDHRALTANAIDSDTPVTFQNLPGENARNALERILRPLQLAWVYQGNGIMITPQDEANRSSYVRVYPVADLVLRGNGGRRWDGRLPNSGSYADFDPLIEMITSTVYPMTWEAAGGPGNIKGFEASMALVCDQTRQVHESLETLLVTLRKSRAAQRVPDLEEGDLQNNASQSSNDDNLNVYRPTVRMRGGQNNIAAWQVPRTKDGKPFRVQTTPGKPDIGQGFGGGLGGGLGGGGAF